MRLNFVFLAIVILSLGACAGRVETEVTRFHQGALPKGETFAVTHADRTKEGPEFAQYATLVSDALQDFGYRPAPTASEADLVVEIDYAVSEGRTRIDAEPGYSYPFYSYRFGVFYPYHHSFVYPHYFDGYGGPVVRSETVYTRRLNMRVLERESGSVAFEGRAVSEGREQEISKIMPYLVESMFRNFPGESGTTKVVDIKTQDGRRY